MDIRELDLRVYHDVYQDKDFPDWWYDDDLLDQALDNDDKRMLSTWISNKQQDMFRISGSSSPQILLHRLLCEPYESINCAEALITGQTPVTVDVNLPCIDTGVYPVHVVSLSCDPGLIELVLFYGAWTDVRLPELQQYQHYGGMLPLQMALQQLKSDVYKHDIMKEWKLEQPMCKFLFPLCLAHNQNYLECISLLAGKTRETAELFLEYAKEEKIVEFTALLMVAHEKVKSIMGRVRGHLDSIKLPPSFFQVEDETAETVRAMRQLVELFDKAGNEISAYVKQDRCTVSKNDTVKDVLSLIEQAGFHLPDFDLSRYMWYLNNPAYPKSNYMPNTLLFNLQDAGYEGKRSLSDYGMAHYSKSGYRWKVSIKDPALKLFNPEAYINELQNEIMVMKEENDSIIREKQQPKLHAWMDEELRKALEEDDKEEFISVVDRKRDFFRPRKQILLYAVCASGAIKCAEALINRETAFNVDLDLPCTDTGLYPLHCAALSLLPSITELFLYNEARIDVRVKPQADVGFKPRNESDCFPQNLLDPHVAKRPLHMALLAISRLPCISEWTPKQSIINLITLFCLPRMQNAMETLELLANKTETKSLIDEFIQCAKHGKIVELVALFMVYNAPASEVANITERICKELAQSSTAPSYHQLEKINEVGRVFEAAGSEISEYMKEDKYDVSKDQVSEDVRFLFKEADYYLSPSDTNLSIYNWYHEEKAWYPSKAPFESVRIWNDIGMDHYSESGWRWEVSEKDTEWRSSMIQVNIKEKEEELKCLEEKNEAAKEQLKQEMKSAACTIPYHILHGIPVASSRLVYDDSPNYEQNVVSDATLQNSTSKRTNETLSAQTSLNMPKMMPRRTIASAVSSYKLRDLPNLVSSLCLHRLSAGPSVASFF